MLWISKWKKRYYCAGNIECSDYMTATKNMFISNGMDANAWCKLYKAELFSDIRYPNCAYEVVPVTYKIYLQAKKIVNIRECGYYIEKRPGSITRTHFGKNNVLYLDMSMDVCEDLKYSCPELVPYAYDFYLLALIAMAECAKDDVTAVYTEEYKKVMNNFKEKYREILRNKKISKRKKIIAVLIKNNMYSFVKKVYRIIA